MTNSETRLEIELPLRAGVTPHRRVVRARVRRPESESSLQPTPWVLLVPGYLASMDWAFIPYLEAQLNAAGIATVAVTLSGSGFGEDPARVTELEAFAHATYDQELEDLSAVRRDVLANHGFGGAPAGVWGHSRGSAMALIHAAEQGGYSALATWATVARVGRYEPSRLAEWRRQGFLIVDTAGGQRLRLDDDLYHDFTENAARYDLLAASKTYGGPALFVHGARDHGVRPSEAKLFAERFAGGGHAQALVIEGTGHNFSTRHPLVLDAEGRVGPSDALRQATEATVAFFVAELQPNP